MSRQFVKSSSTLGLINLASRLLGFVREMLKASLLGASGIGDAFQIAFTIPNLFRRLSAEGVMLNSFVPLFSEAHHKGGQSTAANFLFSLFWLLLAFLCFAVTFFIFYADFLVGRIFAPGFSGETLTVAIFLTRLMFGYILLISIAALFQGVLNHHRVFWISATTPLLLNISIICAGLIAYYWRKDVAIFLAAGVMFGGLLQATVQLPFVIKKGYRFWKGQFQWHPYLSKMLKIALPGIIGAGIYQIDIAISNIIATGLAAGSVVALNLSNRLMELALGVFVISQTTVLLPSIADFLVRGEIKKVRQILSESLSLISFLTIPIILGLLATASEVIEVLFARGRFDQRAVTLTTAVLIFHLPGMIFIGWNRALITCYQAKKMFQSTMWFALVTMVFNASLAYTLARVIDNSGIALANTLSQILLFFLLSSFLFRKTAVKLSWAKLLQATIFKHLLAGGVMFGVVWGLDWGLDKIDFLPMIVELLLKIISAAAVYLTVSLVLKTKELYYVLQIFSKNKKIVP